VKWAFNAPINAKSKRIAEPEGYDPDEVGLTHKALRDHVCQYHGRISKYFCAGVGLELQYTDSCIAERVVGHFADRGLVCLPIHDSFIVQERHKEQLIRAMFLAYADIVGRELKGDKPNSLIRIKGPKGGDINVGI